MFTLVDMLTLRCCCLLDNARIIAYLTGTIDTAAFPGYVIRPDPNQACAYATDADEERDNGAP